MVLKKQGIPLEYEEVAIPSPNENEILVKVSACGICRTDLHIIDGDLKNPKLPLIPGHQVVGEIKALGKSVRHFKLAQRVGIPWLGKTCGHCSYCQKHEENLCETPTFTGYQMNGGLAEYCVADANFCFSVPENYSDLEVAPLLCAGLIGYRSLSRTHQAKRLGLYGFGAAAHIIIQVAKYQGREIFVFTKPNDEPTQQFARKLGADWVGAASDFPSVLLDAAIIFAPAGELVPQALKSICKGGIVVCAGIHMTDIPSFPYAILWGERTITSVANLTRKDGEEFLALAPKIPIKTNVNIYPLLETNQALSDLRAGKFEGAAVIKIAM